MLLTTLYNYYCKRVHHSMDWEATKQNGRTVTDDYTYTMSFGLKGDQKRGHICLKLTVWVNRAHVGNPRARGAQRR